MMLFSQVAFAIPGMPGAGGPHGPTDYQSGREAANNAPISDEIRDYLVENHQEALEACNGDSACEDAAQREHEEAMADAQERANEQRDEERAREEAEREEAAPTPEEERAESIHQEEEERRARYEEERAACSGASDPNQCIQDVNAREEAEGRAAAERRAEEERAAEEAERSERYNAEREACNGDQACIEDANRREAAEAQAAQDARDAERAAEEAERERVRRNSLSSEERYEEDCYGYAEGDSQDSSDFSLKIDCILDTGDQNQAYFTESSNTPGGTAPIENVIIKAINYLMTTIGSVSLLLIVIAGIMMITSPGNENQRSKATEILTSSIIALVVAFSSYIIVNAVQGLFF